MTKVMLWPDVYKEQGHWLPAVSLAKTLQDTMLEGKSYDVEFMGIPDTQSIVSPYDATFNTILADIYPPGHSVNDQVEPIGQRWKPEHLLPLARGVLDGLFIGAGSPDILIVGYFAGLEGLILHHKYGVKLVTLTTFLRHPDEDPAIFAKQKLVYLDEAVARKLILLSTGTEMTFDEFIAPLEAPDQPELIPCPREFDFYDEDWKHDENKVKYVEPMVVREALGPNPTFANNPSEDANANFVINSVPPPSDPPEPTDTKIIFGTSGSQVSDYEDTARSFFLALIDMMKTRGMENHHLVLSVGDKLFAEFRIRFGVDLNKSEHQLPDNVTLARWVSQTEILKRAEVAFIHGGLATVKESIFEKVPMVIFPHGKDQTENALRIRRAGVGIAPQVEEVTPQVLKRLMTEVTASPWIRKRLDQMGELFKARENADPAPSFTVINNVMLP